MKKWIALLLALVMMLSFVACGGEEKGEAGGNSEPVGITGETYNAGNVSALKPDGWLAVPATDIWSEEPNAVDKDQFTLVKDGKSEMDIMSKPYIQILHYEPESLLTPSKELFDDAKDVEPITTGSLTWEGFSAKDLFGTPMLVLWTTNEAGHQFQLNIFIEAAEGKIAVTDADVQAIMESVTNS